MGEGNKPKDRPLNKMKQKKVLVTSAFTCQSINVKRRGEKEILDVRRPI